MESVDWSVAITDTWDKLCCTMWWPDSVSLSMLTSNIAHWPLCNLINWLESRLSASVFVFWDLKTVWSMFGLCFGSPCWLPPSDIMGSLCCALTNEGLPLTGDLWLKCWSSQSNWQFRHSSSTLGEPSCCYAEAPENTWSLCYPFSLIFMHLADIFI